MTDKQIQEAAEKYNEGELDETAFEEGVMAFIAGFKAAMEAIKPELKKAYHKMYYDGVQGQIEINPEEPDFETWYNNTYKQNKP